MNYKKTMETLVMVEYKVGRSRTWLRTKFTSRKEAEAFLRGLPTGSQANLKTIACSHCEFTMDRKCACGTRPHFAFCPGESE